MSNTLPVTFVPLALQPDIGRIYASCPEGWTIEEIVSHVMPGMPDTVLDRVIVTMVNGKSSARVPRRVWHRVRPYAGTQLIIMIAPGRAAFQLLVSIAALAISTFFTAGLGTGLFAGLLKGAISLGVSALGGLLINALFPVKKEAKETPTYAVSGWSNERRPNGQVPVVFGVMRYAPPLAASSYIEVVGDVLYNRMVVCWGYGPLDLSDFKNGETELTKYDEIEIEHRYGYAGDAPLTLYRQQVVEEKVNSNLELLWPRNDAGVIVPGPGIEKPIDRVTARDASYARIILSFPSGLGYVSKNGKKSGWKVDMDIRYRPVTGGAWTSLPSLTISAKKFVGFFREIKITFPTRGAYQIEITRKSPSEQTDSEEGQYALDCIWVVLQSFRPEYPLNFDKPVALTAIRVKSTYQLNGELDTLNGIVKRIAPNWNGTAWVNAITQNPAAHALFALRGPALYKPVPDAMIDFDSFADWHEFCTSKGLKYNRVHDFDGALDETLAAIGAAGRAAVRYNGRKWTVTIDRPRSIPSDHITPRNSSGIRISPSYFDPPHAYRVQFIDETNKWEPAERVIPWPGYSGSIDVTQEIQLPGKTNPDEVWIEARRRQYEMMYRSVVYSATQQGLARTSTTGDLVIASRDIMRRAMASARVLSVTGSVVELDETWTMQTGTSYVVRWRRFNVSDTIGTSVTRTIATVAGEQTSVTLTGSGFVPVAGDLIMFGPATSDSIRLIVVEIERGKDDAAILTMLPAAEIIDTLTDAEDPPAWSGRIGDNLGDVDGTPVAPVITEILSGTTGTGNANGLRVLLAPGRPDPVLVDQFKVRHKLNGAVSWVGTVTCTTAVSSVDIPGYVFGNTVDVQAWSVSAGGTDGAFGPIVSPTIGSKDTPYEAIFDFGQSKNIPLIT